MLKRIGVLTSLAVVAVMFAGVSTASAQTAGVCVFTGLSGNLVPPIEPIQTDATEAPLDVERGDYNFSTGAPANAACAGLFNGNPRVEPNATIVSHGSYDNIYCGTGFAHDLDGLGTTVTAGPDTITGAGYEIPFVAGQGPLVIGPKVGRPSLSSLTALPPFTTDTASSGSQQDPFNRPVSGSFTGIGFVNIVPTNAAAGGCGTAPVSQFNVTGFFIAEDVL